MKKSILLVIVCFLLGIGFWKEYQSLYNPLRTQEKGSVSVLGNQYVPVVTLVLVFEDSIATYSGVVASSAFDALEKVAADKKIHLKTKSYDFGVFVEEIGDKHDRNDFVWLYFINGISGDVAADKKILKTDDIVEWRYMKPTL